MLLLLFIIPGYSFDRVNQPMGVCNRRPLHGLYALLLFAQFSQGLLLVSELCPLLVDHFRRRPVDERRIRQLALDAAAT